MSYDINKLLERANKLGYDAVPDLKPVQAERIILELLNSKPTRCFQTKEIDAILQHEGIRTPSSSMLVCLAEQGKIERIEYGIYRAKIVPERQSILDKIKLIIQKIF